jgi:hypothetical protein
MRRYHSGVTPHCPGDGIDANSFRNGRLLTIQYLGNGRHELARGIPWKAIGL